MRAGFPTISLRAQLLVAALAVLPYLNALGGNFVFDDVFVIRDNPDVMGPHASLAHAMVAPYPFDRLYRPLTLVSYRLNALLDRGPFLYHSVNVFLHAMVSLGVLAVAARVLQSRGAAFVAAALFAVHPIHTEAVTNVVGRAELLAGLFSLAAILYSVPSASGRNPGYRPAFAVLALALALLSKESALTVPAVIGIVWLLPHLRPPSARSALLRMIALLAVVVGFLALRVLVVGTLRPSAPAFLSNPLAHVSAADRVRTALVIVWQYLGLLFVPSELSPDYSPNQIPIVTSFRSPELLRAVAGLFGTALFAARIGVSSPPFAASCGFFLLPLALTANVLFPIGINMAERLLYFPSIGWCLAAGWAANRLLRGRTSRVFLALLASAFAIQTHIRNRDWANDLTLWRAAFDVAPRAARTNCNYAAALANAGHIREALRHYRIALEIYPQYAYVTASICKIFRNADRLERARYWCERSLAIDPRNFEAHLHLGTIHLVRGEPFAALAETWKAHEIKPGNPVALTDLATLAWMAGRNHDARRLVSLVESSFPLPSSARDAAARLKAKLDAGVPSPAPTPRQPG